MLDAAPVRAFLEPRHVEWMDRVHASAPELTARPLPESDADARAQAPGIAIRLARGGWLEAIGAQDLRRVAIAREALGYHSPLADAVFAIQALAATSLIVSGNAAMRDRWLGPLLEGTAIGGFAMTEREAGSDVGALRTTARRDGDQYVIEGEKAFISNAGIADVYVVFATVEGAGISAFVVPASTSGCRFAGAQVMSAPHPLGEVSFGGCRIPLDHRLMEEGKGLRVGLGVLDRLRGSVGATACGMAARALDEALAHARTRRQFGQPLVEFQLVQDKLARMATELVASRLLVYRTAWAKDGGASRVTLEAAMAKSYATEAAGRIVDGAVQILGGRGVMADHVVDHLQRAVRALRIYEGTTEIQRLLIAGQLIGMHGESGS